MNTGVIDVQMMMCKQKYWCAKEQKSKLKQYGDEVGRLDGLCTAAVIGQLMFKISEGNISLQLQRFLQFVPVIGSRELEGKVAKRGVGFGDDQ